MRVDYLIIVSKQHDWYIAAKKVGDKITVLGDGHFRSDALDKILKDMGVSVPTIERRVTDDGTYDPKPRDWKVTPESSR